MCVVLDQKMNIKCLLVTVFIIALLLPDNGVQCWRRRRSKSNPQPETGYTDNEDKRNIFTEKDTVEEDPEDAIKRELYE